jgi:hypothetical protein
VALGALAPWPSSGRRPACVSSVHADPRHVILYTSNNEVRQEFSVVLPARTVGGTPTPSAESREVAWVEPAAVGVLTMDRSMRMRIDRYLAAEDAPYLG